MFPSYCGGDPCDSLLPLQGVLVPEDVLEKRGGHPPQFAKTQDCKEFKNCFKNTNLERQMPSLSRVHESEALKERVFDSLQFPLAGKRVLAPVSVASTRETRKRWDGRTHGEAMNGQVEQLL